MCDCVQQLRGLHKGVGAVWVHEWHKTRQISSVRGAAA